MNETQSMPPSLWAATAEPAPPVQPLDSDRTTDVVVVGGGYAGLSTALHLAEAGAQTLLVEANQIGWGASGRSGGQVIPGMKYDPDGMRRLFGDEAGHKMAQVFGATADHVFDLIERHDIACEATRAGWIQPAHSKAAESAALERCRQWQALGANVSALNAAEVADLLGSNAYHGGWIDRRGGSIQPLSYTRGLARACLAAGVTIHDRTAVSKLRQDAGAWQLPTEGGATIRARRVVLCTNGYTGALWPGLRKSIIAANSFQIATAPLPEDIGADILKGGVVASDTRNLLAYWRRDQAGRLIVGGRGTFDEPTSASDFRHLNRMLARIYPQAADQPIEYRWGGRVAITQDFLPHVHQPADGLSVLIGCQGRGIGLQTAMGRWLADYMASGESTRLPVPITSVRQIPLHSLRRLYVSAMLAYYKMRDLL
ncbi:FAD-dependent oxidoreductase [Salinisphaera sp. T31B1]|uniref:NAD(P)/FAD-dependent oxidoreductase n=1 Tax=Salinisphaera sp. T31B1 TaxID=727963 RepID=UPI003340E251